MRNKKVILGVVGGLTLSFTIIILTLSFTQIFLTLSIEKEITSYNIESIGKEVMYGDIQDIENKTIRWALLDKKFLETAEEVYNLHQDFNISDNYDFDWIYNTSIKIFMRKYTTEIDSSYENNEYIQTIPELVFNNYRGDCDDYAMFFYVMAKKKGLEARYVIGARERGGGHAWIQIKKDGMWIEYDSTSNTICEEGCITQYFELINYLE